MNPRTDVMTYSSYVANIDLTSRPLIRHPMVMFANLVSVVWVAQEYLDRSFLSTPFALVAISPIRIGRQRVTAFARPFPPRMSQPRLVR